MVGLNSVAFKYRKKSYTLYGASNNDHIFKKINDSNCFYELDLLEYIRSLKLSSDEKVERIGIDIGANIGNHSVFFATQVVDYVLAFEPNPAVLPILKENLTENVNNCSVFEVGLGDKPGYAEVSIPLGCEDNVGMAMLSESASGTLEIKTLDNVLLEWADKNKVFTISFLKIDVEGMEPSVLQGALETIEKYKPHLFVEAPSSDELAKILKILSPMGYEKLSRWAATPVYHFAYKPGYKLRVFVKYALCKRWVKRKMKL